MTSSASDLPTIAVAMGDPAGISPELLARLLAEADIRPLAKFVIFGDARVLEQLQELRRRPLAVLVEGLTEASRQHAELASPVDDLVALALRFTRDV